MYYIRWNYIIESVLLGLVQGIAEWLPISSEGLIVLMKANLFSGTGLEDLIKYALFLHLGTFLAAFLYFHKDVMRILKGLFNYKKSDLDIKKLISFLFISTLITGTIGIILLTGISRIESQVSIAGKGITILVGVMLLITGFFLHTNRYVKGIKHVKNLGLKDSVLLGVVQGFSIIPGISRSGITVSTFLLRKYDKTDALKLSFLMSLPIVFGANIILNYQYFTSFTFDLFIGFLSSFVFGILSLHYLIKFSEKINFSYFVFLFGILTILSAFI